MVILGVMFLLTACGRNKVEDIPPLTLEEVAGKRLAQLSLEEKEGLIYRYVSDTLRVNEDNLIAIEQKDLYNINNLLREVSNTLRGSEDKAIPDEFINYLLLEFARTPYEWEQVEVKPIGMDPASRLYFVDVTYKNTNTFKTVIPSSKIPNGSPNEESLKQQRYRDYISYLSYKSRGNIEQANLLLQEFENRWGKVSDVFNEQQGVSLAERTFQLNQDSGGLGKLTYSGLVQDSRFNSKATMTMRYVFKYRYNLGEEKDMGVVAIYLKDYSLDNVDAILSRYNTPSALGVEVLKPFIDQVIISYHKAVEESNDRGLYSLYYDYSTVDKYYDDLTRYTYNMFGGYTFEVLERSGTNVAVKVDRIRKARAKGSDMSLPTYQETLIYNMVLDNDDKIRIRNVHLLKSSLIGEPVSLIKNVSGISETIQYSSQTFTKANREAVEEVLKKFMGVVFSAKVDTPEFAEVVDVGVSGATLQKMTDYITAIPNAKRKVNYLVSWDTRTNVFVSVTMREIFETDEGTFDTESVVDLANRNGKWKVVNYTRTINIKTSGTVLDTKNAFSENVANG